MKPRRTYALDTLAGIAILLVLGWCIGCGKRPIAKKVTGVDDFTDPTETPVPTGPVAGVRDFARLGNQLSSALNRRVVDDTVRLVWPEAKLVVYQRPGEDRTVPRETARLRLIGAFCYDKVEDTAGRALTDAARGVFLNVDITQTNRADFDRLAAAMNPIFSPSGGIGTDELNLIYQAMTTVRSQAGAGANGVRQAWYAACVMLAGHAEAGEL